jgi:N utilization substance protein A
VQSIIKELRGEKIDIIEWSDEPSVFAANALSPAKVSQVRITDIENRQMEVIVGEDQLSLAIGKKGQNVRLATRLVGWDISIVSEEVLKKEIAQQMGRMMASGEAVPITALEGVTALQADALAEKGIGDVEALALTSLDDIVDILDVSLDQAEAILASAKSIVDAKNAQSEGEGETAEAGTEETPAEAEASAETPAETAETAPAESEPEAPSDVDSEETAADGIQPPEATEDPAVEEEQEVESVDAGPGSEPQTEAESEAASQNDETPAENDI